MSENSVDEFLLGENVNRPKFQWLKNQQTKIPIVKNSVDEFLLGENVNRRKFQRSKIQQTNFYQAKM